MKDDNRYSYSIYSRVIFFSSWVFGACGVDVRARRRERSGREERRMKVGLGKDGYEIDIMGRVKEGKSRRVKSFLFSRLRLCLSA